MRIKPFLPAIGWFIISVVLLAMPGEDLPQSEWFDVPLFDKYVHAVMFFLLTFLFCYPFSITYVSVKHWKAISIKIAAAVIGYGIAMEFVQKYFVRGRSFDIADILFDTLGSLGGMAGIWQFFRLKNRPR